eukprot:2462333-Prymnesium_polylepis.8
MLAEKGGLRPSHLAWSHKQCDRARAHGDWSLDPRHGFVSTHGYPPAAIPGRAFNPIEATDKCRRRTVITAAMVDTLHIVSSLNLEQSGQLALQTLAPVQQRFRPHADLPQICIGQTALRFQPTQDGQCHGRHVLVVTAQAVSFHKPGEASARPTTTSVQSSGGHADWRQVDLHSMNSADGRLFTSRRRWHRQQGGYSCETEPSLRTGSRQWLLALFSLGKDRSAMCTPVKQDLSLRPVATVMDHSMPPRCCSIANSSFGERRRREPRKA